MNDRLEDFVKQHREEFDLREPDPSIWLKIDSPKADGSLSKADGSLSEVDGSLSVIKEKRTLRWLRVAAAIAVIFAGSSAGIYFLTGGNNDADLYSNAIYMEMQDTEQYYKQMMAQRYSELEPFLASDPMAHEMLTADMAELDQVYEELQEDLKDNASNPDVIEAMILNYSIKLEILEDLLNQLKEKENQDYENDDSYAL
jgi:predicted CopG family antitoxin